MFQKLLIIIVFSQSDSAFGLLNDYKSRKGAEETLQKLLNENYNRNIRPAAAEDSDNDSTEVTVNIYVKSIEYIDDIKMEYGLEMYFRQQWFDQRLQYNMTGKQLRNNQTVNYLTLIDRSKIWEPNLSFANSKHGSIHEVLAPDYFIRIYPNGEIRTSYRLSLKLSCPMNLKRYPFDRPVCPAIIESYSLSEDDLKAHWKNNTPVQITKSMHLARFSLRKYSTSYCSSTTSTGTYACLKLEFQFERQVSYYLVQIYVPCFMLVVISWIGFWLDESAVDARISLGVTTILTIVTQIYGVNQTTPPVSYTKALDIFTGACEFFVVAALLEFSLVNHKYKLGLKKRDSSQFLETTVESGGIQDLEIVQDNRCLKEENKIKSFICSFLCQWRKRYKSTANRIDQVARIIFPGAFLIFNLIYWPVYSDVLDDIL